MGIYALSWKNLRRNRLRNLSTVLRISLGVIILLILVSSGLGITSIIEKSGTSNGKILAGQNSNQTSDTTNQTNMISSAVNYLNSYLGSTFTENQLVSRLESFLVNVVYVLDGDFNPFKTSIYTR